jgi:hypothetical protein
MTRYSLKNGRKVAYTAEQEAARDAEEAAWAAGQAERDMASLREERNQMLAETDWWASSDLTMTDAQIAYRQALRDITDTYSNLNDVVWPEKP